MSTTTRPIPITDDKGKFLLNDREAEPLPGSVVLTSGYHGTAWQRHFSDGLWYASGYGAGKTWSSLIRRRNAILIYDAEARS